MAAKPDYAGIDGGYYWNAGQKGHKSQRFLYRKRYEFLVGFVPPDGGDVVLDLGCGSGAVSKKMLKMGCRVIGIDVSQSAVKFAKGKAENAEFITANAEALPLKSGSVGTVVCAEVIEHLENPEIAIREIRRVLRKNGRLIVSTPNYLSLWPLAEFVFDKTIANRGFSLGKQHVSKFNYFTIKNAIKRGGFRILKSRTIFIISLAAAVFSQRVAELLFKLEGRLSHTPFGMLVYVSAEKWQTSL